LPESTSSSSTADSIGQAIAICTANLRRHDSDRYFSSLFAGAEGHRALVSLYAFNLEIARIREVVSEPMLGQIRLQWWRDAIGEIYDGSPRKHPAVTALHHIVKRRKPARARLEAMIDGREFDMAEEPPGSLGDLAHYARQTSGELTCLALEILGVRDDASMAVAYDAGIAWALTGLLRAVPFHAAGGRSYLPGISGQRLQENPRSESVRAEIERVAAAASDSDNAFRRNLSGLPRKGRAAVLHNVLARPDLRRIGKAGYDVAGIKPLTPAGRQLRIAWASLTGRM
jgi:phytoene synthase